jgi:hypothetical protein
MIASARQHSLPLIAVLLCLVGALAACRTGVPVLDANAGPPAVMGTITGKVSGEDGSSPVAGRKVTARNVETGEREAGVTSDTGGFTFKLPPGRYRIEVELLAGETLVRDRGEFKLSKSELQHDIDIRIGSRRAPAAGRIYQPPLDTGAPLA